MEEIGVALYGRKIGRLYFEVMDRSGNWIIHAVCSHHQAYVPLDSNIPITEAAHIGGHITEALREVGCTCDWPIAPFPLPLG